RRPVRRTGARPGQGLWITGALGGAALALAQLRKGRKPAAVLFRRFARPEPRIAAGRWLADRGAVAMIDVSDGLAADAGHLAAAVRSLRGSRSMIRTAWFYVVLAFSTVIHATAPIVAAMLRIRHRPGGVYDWGTNDWSRGLLRAAGTKVRAEGLERIPRDRPVVYASNHSSMFDIWAL